MAVYRDQDPEAKSSATSPDDFDMGSDDTLVLVPNVVGLAPSEARQKLEMQRLGVNIVEEPTPNISVQSVIATEPPAESEVERGAVVSIYVQVPEEEEDSEDDQEKDRDLEDERSGRLNEKHQQDRLAQQEEVGQNRLNDVKDAAQTAKKVAQTAEKAEEAAEAATAAAEGTAAAVSTFPIWGTILAILLFIFAIFLLVALLVSSCTQDTWTGKSARILSWISSLRSGTDVCAQFADMPGGRSGGAGGGAGYEINPTPTPTPPPSSGLTDAAARAQLLSRAGVTVNALQPQTSLQGIQQATLDEVVNFAIACSRAQNATAAATSNLCGVVFTGGTETTANHAGGTCSHLSGDKFDIRDVTAVNNFIINSFTRSGTRRSDGAALFTNPGTSALYAREANHWDVIQPGCV